MTILDIRFSDWIQKGFELFTANALMLILSGLVAGAISAVTLGLLAGPMLAGLAVIVLNLMDNRLAKPTVNDVFKGFDYFKDSIPVTLFFYALGIVTLLLQFVPFLGQMVSAVVTSVGASLAVLSVFHLVARNISPLASWRNWFEIFKVNWGPLLGFFILAAIIGGCGLILFGVGLVVTLPLYFCILGMAYTAISSQTAAL
jgi:uncharacterized membrane protein